MIFPAGMGMEAFHVIVRGGPVMIALAITSLLLYKTVIGLLVFVRRVRFDDLAGEQLRRFAGPPPAGGHAAAARHAQEQVSIIDEMLSRFRRIVRGRLKYSHALIIAAPLFGLLGTVEGMLETFRGLSLQLSHEITRTVADGISGALITTETGLIVAIPALFLINWIKRELQRHELRILEQKMRLLSRLEGSDPC
jgi:biopolymer transport protein ExbB